MLAPPAVHAGAREVRGMACNGHDGMIVHAVCGAHGHGCFMPFTGAAYLGTI